MTSLIWRLKQAQAFLESATHRPKSTMVLMSGADVDKVLQLLELRDAPLREGIDIPKTTEADKARGRFHEHVRKCKQCHVAVLGELPDPRLLCDTGLATWTSACRRTFEEVGMPLLPPVIVKEK